MSFEPRQEPEAVDGTRLGWIAAVSVVITIGGILVAWGMTRASTKRPSEYSNVPAPAPRGTVERALLAEPRRGEVDVASKRADLGRWSWVDRDAGTVNMPIDRAIDLWIARSDAAVPPVPQAQPSPQALSLDERAGVELGINPPDWRAH